MRYLILCALLTLTSGCALVQEATGNAPWQESPEKKEARLAAQEKADHKFDGRTEDQIIEEFGAPTKAETLGSYRVYTYYEDHGTTTRGSASSINQTAFGRSRSTHHFHETRFYFKEGKVVKWDEDSN